MTFRKTEHRNAAAREARAWGITNVYPDWECNGAGKWVGKGQKVSICDDGWEKNVGVCALARTLMDLPECIDGKLQLKLPVDTVDDDLE